MVSNRGGSTQSNKNGGSVQDKAESLKEEKENA